MSHQMTQQHLFFLILYSLHVNYSCLCYPYSWNILSRWQTLPSLPTRTLFPDLMINCAFCKNYHIPEKAYSKCHIWFHSLPRSSSPYIAKSNLWFTSNKFTLKFIRGNHVNPVFTWCALEMIETAEYSTFWSIINHCNVLFLHLCILYMAFLKF